MNRIPFVVTYNPMLPNLHKIFKDLQHFLSSSERCGDAFPNTPHISYRRARNLSDMLCSKRLPPSTNQCSISTTPENDTSPSDNTCPDCGLQCKNPKGLKIHRSSKHKNSITNQQHLDSGLVNLTQDVPSEKKDTSPHP